MTHTVTPRWLAASTALSALTLVCLAALIGDSQARAADEPSKDAADRCFEMRTYIAAPGKLEALHKRFRDHTNRLFEKHGMTLVGYWTPTDGAEAENTLVYILAYPSREVRDASWKAFMADPEWQAAYKESHRDGPLVSKAISQFLAPTDYSPIK